MKGHISCQDEGVFENWTPFLLQKKGLYDFVSGLGYGANQGEGIGGGLCGWRSWCSWIQDVVWLLRLTSVESQFRLALIFILSAFKISIQNDTPQILGVHSMQAKSFLMTHVVCKQDILFTMFLQPNHEVLSLPLLPLSFKCCRFSRESLSVCCLNCDSTSTSKLRPTVGK